MAFKAYAPGYLHVDVKYLPQMADGEADQKTVRGTVFPPNARRYLFVAIDRATRWVFIRIYKSRTAANARRLSHAISNGPARYGSAPYLRTMEKSSLNRAGIVGGSNS